MCLVVYVSMCLGRESRRERDEVRVEREAGMGGRGREGENLHEGIE